MCSPAQLGRASSAASRSTALTLTTMRRSKSSAAVQAEVLVRRPGEAVGAGVATAAVRVDRVAERHARGPRDLADDRARADVQVLDLAQLARRIDVVVQQRALRLGAGERPAERAIGGCHARQHSERMFVCERGSVNRHVALEPGHDARRAVDQRREASARRGPRPGTRRRRSRRPARRARCGTRSPGRAAWRGRGAPAVSSVGVRSSWANSTGLRS